MKRRTIIFCALLGVLGIWFAVNSYLTWNNLGGNFFIVLFGDKECKVEQRCSDDNLADLNSGIRSEMYHLTDDSYNTFKAKFLKGDSINIPVYKEHLYHNDSVLGWRKTPMRGIDTLIINIKHRHYLSSTCFTIKQLENILNTKGNFYAAYYDKDDVGKNKHVYDGGYYWFILEGKTKNLYIISFQI